MRTETLSLRPLVPGQQPVLPVLRFGTPGARPKAYIQSALHADEAPALLVAHHLRQQLAALEARGAIVGEVVLLPMANPLGLAQQMLGRLLGRFDAADGQNFNRGHADLSDAVAAAVADRLGPDEARNRDLIRAELRTGAAALHSDLPVADLKHKLLALAIDADVVLDLHCDGEARLHLYALTPLAAAAEELGALLGAEAILLATESGDSPFDEACSRPWHELQRRFAPHPVPLSCFSATVELRGEADTDHTVAAQDACALIEFLRRRGIVAGTPAPLPPARCQATPLTASEPVTAPCAGVVVFHCAPGERVAAGDAVADIVDPASGDTHTVRAQSAGVLYARIATRWVQPGQRLGKIAGTALQRSGKLLSP